MTLITFTSDFGVSDHYVAYYKAQILKELPSAQIIDISHEVRPFDIANAAFVLQSVFKEFPEGTIHLIGGDAQNSSHVIAELDGHMFVGPNNGIISLIGTQNPTTIYGIDLSGAPYQNVLPKIAAQLAAGKQASDLGEALPEMARFMPRKARATKKEIAGHVIHVDRYGNLITNIEQQDFDILSANRRYEIVFGRERANQVQASIFDVDPGEIFFAFNVNGQLMLGINQGNGAQLLGLAYDSPIIIQFQD